MNYFLACLQHVWCLPHQSGCKTCQRLLGWLSDPQRGVTRAACAPLQLCLQNVVFRCTSTNNVMRCPWVGFVRSTPEPTAAPTSAVGSEGGMAQCRRASRRRSSLELKKADRVKEPSLVKASTKVRCGDGSILCARSFDLHGCTRGRSERSERLRRESNIFDR